MRKYYLFTMKFIMFFCLISIIFSPFDTNSFAGQQNDNGIVKQDSVSDDDWDIDEEFSDEGSGQTEDFSDPIEPVNRIFFKFNDKLYFHVVKPVCKAYNKVMPEKARRGIRSFFSHLYTPVRAANCLLQGKVDGFVREVARFIINTTAGGLGFRDAAFEDYHVKKSEEDFGQTLGFYGLGAGPYLVIPFIGPSSLRDAVGSAADSFMYPPNYYLNALTNTGITTYRRINDVSLRLGEYEAFKETAIDPYVSVRQAFYQYRKKQIEK